jgi:hypothetical protein
MTKVDILLQNCFCVYLLNPKNKTICILAAPAIGRFCVEHGNRDEGGTSPSYRNESLRFPLERMPD